MNAPASPAIVAESAPRVSVVVTCYNYARYLPQALDSLLAQTQADFEAVLIDDGSTDETPQVAQRYLADPRLRYHRTEHIGQPAAKNLGIRLTRAPWIAFLDADDRWHSEKLELQTRCAAQDSSADGSPLGVVYCLPRVIDEAGRPVQYRPPQPQRGWVVSPMFAENFVCFSSAMVRREALERLGAFDETIPLAIDYELWLRIAADYRFDYVNQALVDYRTGHANLSSRTEERLEIVLGIMDRYVAQTENCRRLDPATVRRAYVETYGHLALAQRDRSRAAALATYGRSLRRSPGDWGTWRGMISVVLPERARGLLRTLTGRPDWRVKQLAEAAGSPTAHWQGSSR